MKPNIATKVSFGGDARAEDEVGMGVRVTGRCLRHANEEG